MLRGTQDATVTLVHVIHRRNACETQTKDYEFSHLSMTEHWQAGGADMAASLQLLARQGPPRPGILPSAARHATRTDHSGGACRQSPKKKARSPLTAPRVPRL